MSIRISQQPVAPIAAFDAHHQGQGQAPHYHTPEEEKTASQVAEIQLKARKAMSERAEQYEASGKKAETTGPRLDLYA